MIQRQVIHWFTAQHQALQNTMGKENRVSVVAVVNEEVGDWAAYIGATPGHPAMDDETALAHVGQYGDKLSRPQAVAFFPALAEYPYRQ
jgi:hypothetical protein